MHRIWGISLLVASTIVLLSACGSGGRLDTDYQGGKYLPIINQVDTGDIALVDGLFSNTEQNDLVLTDAVSGASLRLLHNNTITSGEQIYDLDADGDLDYVVLTLRALSAQAAANVTATDLGGAQVPIAEFTKVTGAAFLPIDAGFTGGVEITLPISSSAISTFSLAAGESLQLYKFDDLTQGGRTTSDDIGTGTGVWRFVSNVTIDTGGTTVTFTTNSFGQYAVATDKNAHSQGGGSSV